MINVATDLVAEHYESLNGRSVVYWNTAGNT